MDILVTGYKNFIGSHTFNNLKSRNYNVYGYGIDILDDVKYDVIIHMVARGLIIESRNED